jgi:hypothetical protein
MQRLMVGGLRTINGKLNTKKNYINSSEECVCVFFFFFFEFSTGVAWKRGTVIKGKHVISGS